MAGTGLDRRFREEEGPVGGLAGGLDQDLGAAGAVALPLPGQMHDRVHDAEFRTTAGRTNVWSANYSVVAAPAAGPSTNLVTS